MQRNDKADYKSDLVNSLTTLVQNLFARMMYYQTRRLKSEGLTYSSLFLLVHLYKKGPLNLSSLAMATGVTRPTMTAIVEQLVKKRLVERIPDRQDRRKTYISLTRRARTKIEELLTIRSGFRSQIFGVLTIEQLETLLNVAEQVSTIFTNMFGSTMFDEEENSAAAQSM